MAPEIIEEIEELCQIKCDTILALYFFSKFGKIVIEVSFKVEKNPLLGA